MFSIQKLATVFSIHSMYDVATYVQFHFSQLELTG